MKRKLKTAGKVFGGLFAGGAALLGAAMGYFHVTWPLVFPDEPYPQITASTDPEVIAQGEYLFHAVAHCTICHTPKKSFFGNDDVSGMMPVGGHEWALGPLGTLRSANLTVAARDYTDAELARLLRKGVGKDHAVVPLMTFVGQMDNRDLTAVISYVRTLPSQGENPPPSEVSLLGKALLNLAMPGFIKPTDMPIPPYAPPGGVSVERGRYLAEGPALCAGCHTPAIMSPRLSMGEPLMGGGGQADPDPENPEMEMVAPNLTKSEHGALATMDEEGFVNRLRTGRAIHGSPMPWENYKLMTEDDQRSIYRYLASLPPADRDPGPSYRPVGWSP